MSLEGGLAGSSGPLGTINLKKDCRGRAGRGGRSADPRERAAPEGTRGSPGQGRRIHEAPARPEPQLVSVSLCFVAAITCSHGKRPSIRP